MLPGFTRPVPCWQFALRLIAAVSASKRFPTIWIIAAVLHIGVPKPHQTYFAIFLCRHGVLLASLNVAFRRVIVFKYFPSYPNRHWIRSGYFDYNQRNIKKIFAFGKFVALSDIQSSISQLLSLKRSKCLTAKHCSQSLKPPSCLTAAVGLFGSVSRSLKQINLAGGLKLSTWTCSLTVLRPSTESKNRLWKST